MLGVPSPQAYKAEQADQPSEMTPDEALRGRLVTDLERNIAEAQEHREQQGFHEREADRYERMATALHAAIESLDGPPKQSIALQDQIVRAADQPFQRQ